MLTWNWEMLSLKGKKAKFEMRYSNNRVSRSVFCICHREHLATIILMKLLK